MKNNIYAFFGVDGVGKTTTIEGIKKRLEARGKKVVIFRMNRAGGNKLPLIRRVMKAKAKRLREEKGIEKGDKSVKLVDIYRKRGVVFLLVYYLDLLLRYGDVKKLAKDNVVLLDRYFYDGLALTSKKWLPLFSKITPRPEKSFFLWAPPEVVLSRKKEASAENMVDYAERVEKDFSKYFDITRVDASKPLRVVLDEVESAMVGSEGSIYRKVLERFNEEGINYCVLRGYDDPEFTESEDLDILILSREGRKVKNILSEMRLVKRAGKVGPKIICDKRFDIKVGCLDYDRFFVKGAEEILENKRKESYFYVMGKEDELFHLILKAMSTKSKRKKYLKDIESLFRRADLKKVEEDFRKSLGEWGVKVFDLFKKKRYDEALEYIEPLRKYLKSEDADRRYTRCRMKFPCLKRKL